eukprot:596636-Amphidinium_carterae.1
MRRSRFTEDNIKLPATTNYCRIDKMGPSAPFEHRKSVTPLELICLQPLKGLRHVAPPTSHGSCTSTCSFSAGFSLHCHSMLISVDATLAGFSLTARSIPIPSPR